MADNFDTDAGTGGVTFASDDIGPGVHYPRTKISLGADGSVTDALGGTGVDAAGVQRVTLATDISLPTGPVTNAGTFVVQEDGALLTAAQLMDDVVVTLGTDTYTETTSKGNVIGAVRNDTLAALAGTDNEFSPLQVNTDGALWTDFPDAVEDSNNSTSTPINANIDFTGTSTDVTPYAGITVNIFASHDSDANGMRFEFSSDGTNWDIPINGGFDYLAGTGRTFQFDILAKFFRVVFQNAGTNQTAFRFQTLLHHHSVSLTTIHRLDSDLAPDRSATVNKSVLMAQKAGAGDFTPINSTAGGNLKMSVQEISDGLDIGAGNAGSETQRVSISTDDVNLSAVKTATETVAAAVSTQMQCDIVAALPAGTNAIGKLAANSGVDIGDVDVLSIAAGSNLVGDVGLSGARTSGGTTIFRSIDLDEGALEVVKASAGQIYWIHVINLSASTRFVKIYNATSGTIGTGTPVLTFPIPTQGDTNGAGFTLSIPNGIAFSTGISIGASTGIADNDTGAPGANEVVVNLGFA